jgi:hypothetical protein
MKSILSIVLMAMSSFVFAETMNCSFVPSNPKAIKFKEFTLELREDADLVIVTRNNDTVYLKTEKYYSGEHDSKLDAFYKNNGLIILYYYSKKIGTAGESMSQMLEFKTGPSTNFVGHGAVSGWFVRNALGIKYKKNSDDLKFHFTCRK